MPYYRALPAAPLLTAIHCSDDPAGAARRLRVNVGSVHRWRKHGVPYRSSDDVALRAGLHPLEVWPDWLEPEHRIRA